ncbi:hypothetical protein JD844_027951, partial [Phrynosoma platyrhinos]
GISREPKFISKRRIPYHNTQVSKSFEWNGENESEKDTSSEPEIHQPLEIHASESRDEINQEKIKTPDAPRLPEKTHSSPAGSRSELTVALSKNKKAPPILPLEEKRILTSAKKDLEKISSGFNRALQRKAGMNIPQSSSFPRSSEYQRQFVWKTPQKLSPVLAADQHEKTEIFSKTTDEPSKQSKSETVQKQQKQKHKPLCLHRKFRKMNTEYRSNFLSPAQYMYKDGAWLRIRRSMPDQVKELREKAEAYRQRIQGTHFSRDHLNQILSENNRLWDLSSDSSAEEAISNNVRALDLAGVPEKKLPPGPEFLPQSELSEELQENNTGKLGMSDAATLPVKRRLVWGEPGNDEQLESQTPVSGGGGEEEEEKGKKQESEEVKQPEESGKNTTREDQQEENENALAADMADSSSESYRGVGRLPTPELRALGGAQRTHLDLTTPATGGAVLVSPPKVKPSSSMQMRKGSPEKNTLTNQISREDIKRKSNMDENEAVMLSRSLPAGLKTVDPLSLRKDQWPRQETCSVKVPSTSLPSEHASVIPGVKSAHSYWNPSCRIQGTLREPEFQHNGWKYCKPPKELVAITTSGEKL